jgi:cytosine/adenosine deaminase-related metal-dependent hydrolase
VRLVLRGARSPSGAEGPVDVALEGDRVVEVGRIPALRSGDREVDVEGCVLLPGFVNAHDVLDASTFPPTGLSSASSSREGRPPFRNLYEWLEASVRDDDRLASAVETALPDRLFLGGLRNLLAGVTAAAHHGPDHRSLGRADFPVRVLRRYGFAHSPGLTPELRRTYRTTDRRIPWFVRAAAGADERAAAELDALAEANLLRQNTVLVHGTALRAADAPRLAAARVSVVWCPEVDERLFGAQPPVRELVEAGVAVGLGSASPATGSRDFLTTLAAARATSRVDEGRLFELATSGGAAVARLPVGRVEAGAPADLVLAERVSDLLSGARSAVRLVVVAGRPRYGDPRLLEALVPATTSLTVEGTPRALAEPLGRRLASLVTRRSRRPVAEWLLDVML